jgi:hypothetical protein
MQDASVALIAFAFTFMAVGSSLRAPLKARLAIFVAGAVLALLSFTVPIRMPVSRDFGDALDIVALTLLALATAWALFSRQRSPRKPEGP